MHYTKVLFNIIQRLYSTKAFFSFGLKKHTTWMLSLLGNETMSSYAIQEDCIRFWFGQFNKGVSLPTGKRSNMKQNVDAQ